MRNQQIDEKRSQLLTQKKKDAEAAEKDRIIAEENARREEQTRQTLRMKMKQFTTNQLIDKQLGQKLIQEAKAIFLNYQMDVDVQRVMQLMSEADKPKPVVSPSSHEPKPVTNKVDHPISNTSPTTNDSTNNREWIDEMLVEATRNIASNTMTSFTQSLGTFKDSNATPKYSLLQNIIIAIEDILQQQISKTEEGAKLKILYITRWFHEIIQFSMTLDNEEDIFLISFICTFLIRINKQSSKIVRSLLEKSNSLCIPRSNGSTNSRVMVLFCAIFANGDNGCTLFDIDSIWNWWSKVIEINSHTPTNDSIYTTIRLFLNIGGYKLNQILGNAFINTLQQILTDISSIQSTETISKTKQTIQDIINTKQIFPKIIHGQEAYIIDIMINDR